MTEEDGSVTGPTARELLIDQQAPELQPGLVHLLPYCGPVQVAVHLACPSGRVTSGCGAVHADAACR